MKIGNHLPVKYYYKQTFSNSQTWSQGKETGEGNIFAKIQLVDEYIVKNSWVAMTKYFFFFSRRTQPLGFFPLPNVVGLLSPICISKAPSTSVWDTTLYHHWWLMVKRQGVSRPTLDTFIYMPPLYLLEPFFFILVKTSRLLYPLIINEKKKKKKPGWVSRTNPMLCFHDNLSYFPPRIGLDGTNTESLAFSAGPPTKGFRPFCLRNLQKRKLKILRKSKVKPL